MNTELIEKLSDEYINYLKIRLFIKNDLRWVKSDNTYECKTFYKHYSLAKYESIVKTLKILGFEMNEIDEKSTLRKTSYSIYYNGNLIREFHHVPFSEIQFDKYPLDMLLA